MLILVFGEWRNIYLTFHQIRFGMIRFYSGDTRIESHAWLSQKYLILSAFCFFFFVSKYGYISRYIDVSNSFEQFCESTWKKNHRQSCVFCFFFCCVLLIINICLFIRFCFSSNILSVFFHFNFSSRCH